MPASEVSIEALGRSWTLARRMRVAVESMTTAPSIFDSSRSRAAESSASIWKPPEEISSTVSS